MTPHLSVSRGRSKSVAFGAGLFLVAATLPAASVTHTLTSGTNGSWDTSGNWTNGVPDAAGDTAAYSTASTAATVTLDKTGGGVITIGKLTKTASGNFNVNTGTASGLLFDNTGGTGNAVIQNSSGSGTLSVSPSVSFQNTNLDITSSGGSVTIGGGITAASAGLTLGLKHNGGGTTGFNLNGAIGATGGNFTILSNGTGSGAIININGNLGSHVTSITQNVTGATPGTLVLAGNNSAFTGDITTTTGTINANVSTALSSANRVNLNGGNFTFTNSVTVAGLSGGAGNVYSTGTGVRILTLGGSGDYVYSSSVATASQTANQIARTSLEIALTGSGSQILSGASVYGGGTTVTSGTLLVSNTTGSGLGTGAVAVNGGTLGGVGFIAGATTVTGGNLAAGTDGTVGTLTFDGTLNIAGLTGSGQLKFDLDATGASDKVLLSTGVLSIGSGALNFDDFSFSALAGFGNGVYTLFDSSTSISGTLGSSRTGTINGHDAVLWTDGQDIFLTVSGGASIPEPSSCALLIGALALTGAATKRRRQRLCV